MTTLNQPQARELDEHSSAMSSRPASLRPQRIRRLIETRQATAEVVRSAKDRLGQLDARLRELETLQQTLLERLEPGEPRTRLQDFSVGDLSGRLADLMAKVGRMLRRFERNLIQVGVLGRAGQGKSTLLQSLTGLDGRTIPSNNRGHCTGARSLILHDPAAEQTTARIVFYSPDEFFQEVVAPYYDYFEYVDRREQSPMLRLVRPSNLTAFRSADLDRSDLIESGLDAEVSARLQHLQAFQRELPRFEHLLGRQPVRVQEREILEYVAQEDGQGNSLFQHNAVRLAEISCRFPEVELAGLALVDMPGLGDTGIGHEERLIRAISEDTDAVLLVRRPDNMRAYWADVDVSLHRVAARALEELLPIEHWMWLVLNQTREPDNRLQCDLLAKPQERLRHGIQVARVVITDCSSAQSVLEGLLDPLLGFLEQELHRLDALYLANLQTECQGVLHEIAARCESGKCVVPRSVMVDGEFPQLWWERHEQFRRTLNNNLEDLVKQMRLQRTEPDHHLQNALEAVLGSLRDSSLVPSALELAEERNQHGNMMAALGVTLERVRSSLTHRLIGLDHSLHETFGEARQKLIDALENSGLVVGRDTTPGVEPFRALQQMAEQANCARLAECFRFIAEFQLTYFGFIHHRIRKHLDPLIPDAGLVPSYADGEEGAAVDWMRDAVLNVLGNIRKEAEQLTSEPSMSRFAMVEEFKDLALRRQEIQDEWMRYTRYFRESLWPDDFSRIADEQGLHKSWLDALRLVQSVAAEELRLVGEPVL